MAWKGKSGGEKHKLVCPQLAARNSQHKLLYQVRVICTASGASIEHPDAIPKARLAATKAEREIIESQDLSEYAKDHYLSVIQNLTEEQMKERYQLACIERWGGQGHYDEVDGERDTVSLETLLGSRDYESCSHCGSDGTQFFSFCLNRPVKQ